MMNKNPDANETMNSIGGLASLQSADDSLIPTHRSVDKSNDMSSF